MSKRGRKPKLSGPRHANGHRTREAYADDARQVAVEARIRHYGVCENIARQADTGYQLGRMRQREYISRAQYEAGLRFAEAMRAYLSTKLGCNGTASAQDVDRRGASLTETPLQRQEEARAYIDALGEVDCLYPRHRSTTAIVWCVCYEDGGGQMDLPEIGRLREGLNAIVRVIVRRERMARGASLSLSLPCP